MAPLLFLIEAAAQLPRKHSVLTFAVEGPENTAFADRMKIEVIHNKKEPGLRSPPGTGQLARY
jgi:hypothetical protein